MEHKRTQTDKGRYYEINGVAYPSVTNILNVISKGPALLAWAAKQGSLANMKAVQTEALNIGSEAHQLIDLYLKKLPFLLEGKDKAVIQAFDNFVQWAKENNFELLHSEFVCFSKKWGYAGTADGLGRVNGDLCLIDWKTSSGVWDEYFLQTEAYLQAVEEMADNKEMVDGTVFVLPQKLTHRLVLRLSKKDNTFQPALEPRNIKDFTYFLSALDLWHGMDDMKTRYSKYRPVYKKEKNVNNKSD